MSAPHIVPVGDLIAHSADPDCPCGPDLDISDGDVWVHHSLDNRESKEQK